MSGEANAHSFAGTGSSSQHAPLLCWSIRDYNDNNKDSPATAVVITRHTVTNNSECFLSSSQGHAPRTSLTLGGALPHLILRTLGGLCNCCGWWLPYWTVQMYRTFHHHRHFYYTVLALSLSFLSCKMGIILFPRVVVRIDPHFI